MLFFVWIGSVLVCEEKLRWVWWLCEIWLLIDYFIFLKLVVFIISFICVIVIFFLVFLVEMLIFEIFCRVLKFIFFILIVMFFCV